MTVSTNINFMAQSVESLLVNGDINHFEGLARNQFRGGYYNYYGTNGREQMLLGRFSSVQQIDPIIAQVNKQGIIGGSVVWSSLVRLLPRFIYPNKPRYFNSYHIVVDLGLITPAGGKYPTVPLAGQVYAGYGMAGVFVIPFLTFLIFLLLLKKLGWNLYRNIYAIYFFVVFVFIGAGQDSFGQFTGSALRGLPLFTIVFWILVEVSRVQWREVLRR
jgi:hypothetical protein